MHLLPCYLIRILIQDLAYNLDYKRARAVQHSSCCALRTLHTLRAVL